MLQCYMVNFENNWDEILAPEFKKDSYLQLRAFLKAEYANQTVYPPMHELFNCFRYTSYQDVRIVILGQDPYHGAGQAEGLCFSVKTGVIMPPSLVNIFKEINDCCYAGSKDIMKRAEGGSLVSWAKQGVFLLNTLLTVRAGQPMSHKNRGWEEFTDAVIQLLNKREDSIIFMLWGSPARKKKELITNPKHLILEAVHPSPLSAHSGWFGCKHFKLANDFLIKNGKNPITWL